MSISLNSWVASMLDKEAIHHNYVQTSHLVRSFNFISLILIVGSIYLLNHMVGGVDRLYRQF